MTQSNPFAPPTASVPYGTPPPADATPFGPKPRWRHRAGALLLDLFVLSLLGAVLNGLLLLLGAPFGHGVQVGLAVLGFVLGFVLYVAYLVRQGRTGGTYSKDLVGLRLLDVRTGAPIRAVPGVLRPVAHVADVAFFFVGFLRPLWHPEGKTFADSMQRSIVVRSEPRPTPLGTGPLGRLVVVAVLLYATLTGAALRIAHVRGEERAAAEPGRVAAELSSRPASPAPRATAAPLASGDLEGRFLTPPSGFVKQSDSSLGFGRLDAAGVSRVGGLKGQAATDNTSGLRLLGYRSGLAHAWSGDGALYIVSVYEFKDAEGARKLVALAREDVKDTFRSATVPGALTYEDRSGGFYRQRGDFAEHNHVYELTVASPSRDAGHVLFDSLLKAQRDKAVGTG